MLEIVKKYIDILEAKNCDRDLKEMAYKWLKKESADYIKCVRQAREEGICLDTADALEDDANRMFSAINKYKEVI